MCICCVLAFYPDSFWPPMNMASRILSPNTHEVLSSLRIHKPMLPQLLMSFGLTLTHHHTFYPQLTSEGILKHLSLFTLELRLEPLHWAQLG